MARLGIALGDGRADFKALGQLSRWKDLDFDAAVGEELHLAGERLGADLHQRAAAPAGRHFPFMFGFREGAIGKSHTQCKRGDGSDRG